MPADTNDRPVLSAFVLALLLLAAATYLYSFYQQKQKKEVAIENSNNLTRTQKHPQLYCIQAVTAGAIVTTDCLEIREVTKDTLPAGNFYKGVPINRG